MGDMTGGTVTWVLDADPSKLDAKIDNSRRKSKSAVDEIEQSGRQGFGGFATAADSSFSRAGAATDAFGSKATSATSKVRDTFGEVAKGTLAVVGLTSAIDVARNVVGASVGAFGDFESGLGLLRSVTQATNVQMASLKATAVALGKDISLPGVSAADAAQAMTELGKAGLGVNDILAASKGVLQAAKAGNIGVAESAKIVSSTLLAFKLSGNEATRVADLFAGAANASNAEILDLGLGLQQTSAAASSLNVPVEQSVAALAGLANAGIQASDAGTSLKTFFASMTPNSKPAILAMEKLGISFFDAKGNFVGLRRAIELLENSTKGLSQEQRQLAIETIFGSDASRAAIVLASQGVAGFDKLTSAITRQGIAADVAGARNSGIKGSIDALRSNLETAALGFGEFISKGIKPLVDMANGNLPVALSAVAGGILGIGAAALIATFGVAGLGAAITAALFATGIGAAVAVVVAGLAILQQKFDIVGRVVEKVRPLIEGIAGTIKLLTQGDFTGGMFGLQEDDPFVVALLTVHRVAQELGSYISGTLSGAFKNLKSIFQQLSESLKPVFSSIGDFFQKNRGVITTFLKAIAVAVGVLTFGPVVLAIGLLVGALKLLEITLGFVAKHFEVFKRVALVIGTVVFAPIIIAVGLAIGAFKLLQAAVGVISTSFGVLASIWNSVLFPVFNAWLNVMNFIGQAVFKTFAFISLVILGTLSIIAGYIWNNFLSPVLSMTLAGFRLFYEYMVQPVIAATQFVLGLFGRFAGLLAETFGPIVSAVADGFRWVYRKVVEITSSIGDAVGSAIGRVVEFFGGLGRRVLNALGDTSKVLYDPGKNMIQGLLEGAGSILSKVGEFFLHKLPDWMRDPFKKALGIHSPSTVFAGYGENIVQGLVNGIGGSRGKIGRAISSLNSELEVNSGIKPRLASSGVETPIMPSPAVSNTIQPSQQIVVNFNPSGIVARSRSEWREIMKDGVEAINEELRARRLPQLANGSVQGTSTAA